MSEKMYEGMLSKERIRFFFFACLAIAAPFFAFFVPWRPEHVDFGSWFSRSGAAMVVLALLAEANAIKIFNIFNPSGFPEVGFNEFKAKNNHWPALLNQTAFTLIAIGTLIWGYGDIPFINA